MSNSWFLFHESAWKLNVKIMSYRWPRLTHTHLSLVHNNHMINNISPQQHLIPPPPTPSFPQMTKTNPESHLTIVHHFFTHPNRGTWETSKSPTWASTHGQLLQTSLFIVLFPISIVLACGISWLLIPLCVLDYLHCFCTKYQLSIFLTPLT